MASLYDLEGQVKRLNWELFSLRNNICCANQNLCNSINTCLGISPEGDPTLVLNQQGDFIVNSAAVVWGGITGTLSNQTDLQAALDAVSGAGWKITGNSGLTAGTNFLGNTDNVDIWFKVNNEFSGVINRNSGNTAIGNNSLGLGLSVGASNSAFGANSLNAIGSGIKNTGIGEEALSRITTPNNNTAIGASAGLILTTGGNNTLIGTEASVGAVNTTNSIALGYQANAASNQFAINSSITAVSFAGAVVTHAGDVNTATHTDKVRVVIAAGAVTVSATTDYIVIVAKTVGAATIVNLPAGVAGQQFIIKDGNFDANTNNITVTPATGNIDNNATYVINIAGGSITIVYSGTQWLVL